MRSMQLLCEKCSRACINPILPLPDETLHAGEFFGSEVSPLLHHRKY